ncbi:MAG: hypothetical protein EP311_06500 [Cytophagales bacterium]|uniref:Lipid-binding hydrolase n=1 Tax=Algoriphagus taiwanensis TaxID=1445656 RepID=A0ABQ6Q549_9BACT|nr:MAG: hypothetical protein EP311_06500 [Cytophagales bacterium]GMQ25758.1 hypothetical protein Aoki45_24400 [Algoriphagus sp. oki45]GMQ34132.1 hypothetical protein Ataiwa_24040 [Algoriphagus taiwanensis]
MKTIEILRKLALLAFVLAFMACSSDDEVPQGALNVEMTIDGVAWKGAGNSRIENVAGFTAFAIGAGATDRSSLALTMTEERTGNFNLAGNAVWITSDQVVHNAISGTLTITKLENNKVSGTFSFKARPALGGGTEVNITNGSFTDVNIMR